MSVFLVRTRVMLVATFTRGDSERVISAVHTPEELTATGELQCVVCGDRVEPCSTPSAARYEFEHVSGASPCTGSERMTIPHQHAVEMSMWQVSTIVPRAGDVTVEKRVGDSSRFVTADVYCDADIAVEVYHKSSQLGLKRRLETYFSEGFTVFLVFVSEVGRYNPTRIEQHLQCVSGGDLHVGRYNPRTHQISIGSPLTEARVSVSRLGNGDVPAYIA